MRAWEAARVEPQIVRRANLEGDLLVLPRAAPDVDRETVVGLNPQRCETPAGLGRASALGWADVALLGRLACDRFDLFIALRQVEQRQRLVQAGPARLDRLEPLGNAGQRALG